MTSPTPAAPTLEEVARRAGVSRATVSRVINDSPKVSPEAREAVLEAVAELQYVPNQMARNLVRRRTDTLALVLSEPDTRLFSDPFFASIVRGVSAALADTERNLVLLTARDRREQEKVGRYVMQGHVDGVIFMSLHREDVLPEILDRTGIPVVLSGRPLNGRVVAYVDADNVGGGRTATELLLGAGRHAVGSVTGPADMVAGIDRHAGYRAAFDAAGIPVRDDLVEAGDFTEQGGRRATEVLLARAPELDGLFVASDPMAVGALAALRAAGRRVPDDVAVVGFDDAELARDCDPPLTTVAQPLPEMARLMTDLLVARIEGTAGAHDHHVVPTTLVRRASA